MDLKNLLSNATYEEDRLGFLTRAIYLARASDLAYKDDANWTAKQLGVSRVHAFGYPANQLIPNTCGFWFRHDKVAALVFRGSKTKQNWLANFDVFPLESRNHPWGTVHPGFWASFQCMIDSELSRFAEEAEKADTIWLSGHSLGGAFAVLAAAWLKQKKGWNANILTYGQPMTGLADFKAQFDRELPNCLTRIINGKDVIPRLPGMDYVHIGQAKKIKGDGLQALGSTDLGISDEDSAPANLEEFQDFLNKLEATPEREFIDAQPQGAVLGAHKWIYDHRIRLYVEQLILVQQRLLSQTGKPVPKHVDVAGGNLADAIHEDEANQKAEKVRRRRVKEQKRKKQIVLQATARLDFNTNPKITGEPEAEVSKPERSATGFLLPGGWLLTCHHVIKTKDTANEIRAIIGYNRGKDGWLNTGTAVHLKPAKGFFSGKENDWTLVRVARNYRTLTRGVSLEERPATPSEYANMYEHPLMMPLKIGKGIVSSATENWVTYTIHTKDGSSGSPVINDNGDVIAMHHGENDSTSNKGIPISAIIRQIKEANNSPWPSIQRWGKWPINRGIKALGCLLFVGLVVSLLCYYISRPERNYKAVNVREGRKTHEIIICPIPRGIFSRNNKKDAKGNSIEIQKDFWLGQHEVTQSEWRAVMKNVAGFQEGRLNPSFHKGDEYPVEGVTWTEAKRFCDELTRLEEEARTLPTGYKFDLPTEEQWEYACRADTSTPFHYGDCLWKDEDARKPKANFKYHENELENQTEEVGSYVPNKWGLLDMHGNVWEFCRQPNLDEWTVKIRGGCYFNPIQNCTSTSSETWKRGTESDSEVKPPADLPTAQRVISRYAGFRVALVPEDQK